MYLRRWSAAKASRSIAVAALVLSTTFGIAFPELAHGSTYPFRFFSSTSFWNTQLADNAPVDPRSAEVVGAFDAEVSAEIGAMEGPSVSTTSYSVPLYTVPEDQPTVRLRLESSLSAPSLQSAWQEVPLPPDAKPAEGNDGHLAVWQPSTGRLWEFWRLVHGTNGWQASWGGAMQDARSDSGVYEAAAWPGADQSWGASASSLPIVGGLITLEDLDMGVINHALAIGIPNVRAGFYASPARRSDGKSAAPLSLPEGAQLRLDPELNLAALNLPPLTLMIARAAQRYGIFVRDGAHDVTFYGQDPTPTGTEPYRGAGGYFEGRPAFRLLESFPWSHLQLIKMGLHPTQPPATTTTLQLSGPSATYGSEGTVTAEVAVSAPEGLVPSGWVTVKSGPTQLCAVKLEGGAGSCSMSSRALNAGTYPLSAVYPGTADLAASTSEPATLSVGVAPTRTAVSLSGTSATYGSEGAVTAEVAVSAAGAVVPSGWVAVKSGPTQLCAAKLAGGVGHCSMSPKALDAGAYALTAAYPGNPNLGASGSAPAALSVRVAPTMTRLHLSAESATYGSEGTVAAEISVSSPEGLVPSGWITVKSGPNQLCAAKLEAGVGSCSMSPRALDAGAYSLTAVYAATPDFGASTSDHSALSVGVAPTTAGLQLAMPSVIYGAEGKARAEVSVSSPTGLVPSGWVTVKSGPTQLCAAKLEAGVGRCSMSARALNAGANALTAVYPGTPDLGASTSAPAALTVGVAPTTTTVSLSASSATYGSEASVAAEVSVSAPTGLVPSGWVTVKSGQTELCAARLEAGVGRCSMSATELDAGAYALTALYPGTPNLAASGSEPAALTVGFAPTATALRLSAPSAVYGTEGTVEAEVSISSPEGLVPSGWITVNSGANQLCAAKLEAGVGQCSMSAKALDAGAYSLTAVYPGTPDFGGSASEAASLAVGAAATTTSLSLSASSVVYGSEQTVKAEVSVSAPAGLVPGGSVTIKSGQTQLCAAKLEGGTGSCSVSAKALDAGDYALTAVYPGTPDLAASDSGPAPLSVGVVPTNATLQLSAGSVLYGGEQTVVAEVSVSAPTDLVPSGWVTVKSEQTQLCAAKLEGGVGHCSMSAWALQVGDHSLTAVYPGTPDLGASASEPAPLTVGAAPE